MKCIADAADTDGVTDGGRICQLTTYVFITKEMIA